MSNTLPTARADKAAEHAAKRKAAHAANRAAGKPETIFHEIAELLGVKLVD